MSQTPCLFYFHIISSAGFYNAAAYSMGILPDTYNRGLRMRRECRERLPPPPTLKETASYRSRHASRHVRYAIAVMHAGIANPRRRGNVPGIPDAYASSYLRIWQEAHWSVTRDRGLPNQLCSVVVLFIYHNDHSDSCLLNITYKQVVYNKIHTYYVVEKCYHLHWQSLKSLKRRK